MSAPISTVISDLPCEILQKVALCLPRTADVFHLSLATRYLRASLTDPVLYKRRLSLEGWDVKSWEEEDRDLGETEATGKGEIQTRSDRWMRIDHIHSRVHELFVEGSSSRAIAPHTSPMILSGQGSHNGPNKSLRGIASEQRDGTAELGQKILWLANVGRLLPAVIMHHREHNLTQLTSPLFSPARSTIIRAVNEFAFADKPEPQWQDEAIIPAALLEQLSFCVTVMFFAGDTSSLISRPSHLPHSTSIQFYNALLGYGHRHSQRRDPSNIEYLSPTFGAGDHPCDLLSNDHPSSIFISKRFSGAYIKLASFHAYLVQFIAAQGAFSPNLLPPNFAHTVAQGPLIDPTPWLAWSDHREGPCSLSQISERPWLDLGHSSDNGKGFGIGRTLSFLTNDDSEWAGYYVYSNMRLVRADAPMHFTLRATSIALASPDTYYDVSGSYPTPPRILHFDGSGSDGIATFTLVGSINLRTGLVEAVKDYAGLTTTWNWAGVVTPFGMVGKWGNVHSWGGWWWIWPRKWSE